MGKNPKDRHFQNKREPATIDLAAEDVTRLDPETVAADDATSDAMEANAGEAAAGDIVSDEGTAMANDAGMDVTGTDEPAAEASDVLSGEGPVDEPVATPSEDAANAAESRDRWDETAAAAPPVAPKRKSGGIGMVAAGVIGSAVTLAGAGGAWYAGLLPERGDSASQSAQMDGLVAEIAALKAQTAENKALIESGTAAQPAGDPAALEALTKEIGKIAEEVKGLGTDVSVLRSSSGNPADAEAASKLADRLKGIEDKIAALPADGAAPADAAGLGAVVDDKLAGVTAAVVEVRIVAEGAAKSAGEAAKGAKANAEAVSALAARADKLGEQLGVLSGKVTENAGQGEVARTIAAAALKSAIDRGVPFMTELETFAQITEDSEAIGALRGMAASGVPTRGTLSEMAPDAAYAMIAATETVPENAGLLDRLAQSARGLVKMRAVGEVEGEGVQALSARLEGAVQRGDYAKALEEYEKMPPEAKTAGSAFIEKVKARIEADRLIDDVLATALRSAAREG